MTSDKNISRDFFLRNFSPGVLKVAIDSVCRLVEFDPTNLSINRVKHVDEESSESLQITIDDLEMITSLASFDSLRMDMNIFGGERVWLNIENTHKDLNIYISAKSIETCKNVLNILQTKLELKPIKPTSQGTTIPQPSTLLIPQQSTATKESNNSPELIMPETVTLKWIWENVSLAGWVAIFGIALVIFGVGVYLGTIPSFVAFFDWLN